MGLMDRTDAIDLDHLDAYTGGDQQVQSEVLGIFKHQAEMWTRLLSAEDGFQDAAHTIKGASKGIGAWALADICDAAEVAAKAGDLTPAKRSMHAEEIREGLDLVLTDIAVIEHNAALQSLRTRS